MNFFRIAYRLIALFSWLIAMTIFTIPYRFMGWKGRKKISQIVNLLMRGNAKIMGLSVKVHGRDPGLPAGLVVSNHLGYLDIFVHGTIFPLRYTSTTVIAKWPLLGKIIDLSYPVLVDRTSKPAARKALRDFAKTMKNGLYLIVYPEGTSTDGKNGIRPFKSTPFEAATFANLPVIPILTRYREVPGRSTVCWYGDMTFTPHVWQVLSMPKIEADVYFMEPIYPEDRTRKELAEYVHRAMDSEYRNITAQAEYIRS